MRILHLIPELGLGGAQRMLAYTAAAMDLTRYQLEVAHWSDPADLQEELEGLGVKVVRLKVDSFSLPHLASAVIRHLRHTRPTIVHTHLFDADLVGVLAARLIGIRSCCVTIHNSWFFDSRIHRWRYRFLLAPLVRRFLPVSPSLGQLLIRRCRLPSPRVQVIVNGVDTRRFSPQPGREHASNRALVVGALCRLEPNKGIQYLIEAVAKVHRELPDVTLLVGGTGREGQALRKQVSDLGLASHVAFLGAVHQPEEFYRQIDVFAFPSLTEGFGLVALEAMAMGLPVISTNVGGMPDLIADRQDGILVGPQDSDAMAAAIRSLCTDSVLRKQLGVHGRQTALRFDISLTAQQTQAAYEVMA